MRIRESENQSRVIKENSDIQDKDSVGPCGSDMHCTDCHSDKLVASDNSADIYAVSLSHI